MLFYWVVIAVFHTVAIGFTFVYLCINFVHVLCVCIVDSIAK